MRIHFSPRFVTLPGFAGRSRRHFSNFVLDPALGQRAVKGKIIIGQDLQGRRPAFCRECVCGKQNQTAIKSWPPAEIISTDFITFTGKSGTGQIAPG